jgi:hypothetical protein
MNKKCENKVRLPILINLTLFIVEELCRMSLLKMNLNEEIHTDTSLVLLTV